MRRHRRAKIVATVGPASDSPEMLKALFLAGVDTFRLNFSHGSESDHAKVHAAIRRTDKSCARLGESRTSPVGFRMQVTRAGRTYHQTLRLERPASTAPSDAALP
jgi:hypothetical protein